MFFWKGVSYSVELENAFLLFNMSSQQLYVSYCDKAKIETRL